MGYVILDRGTDYNDEYYSIGGDNCKVQENGFVTVEAAREAVRAKLKSQLQHYQFDSFSEGAENAQEALELWGEWKELDPKVTVTNYNGREYRYTNWDWEVLETDWSAFIEEAEKRGVEWINKVPELYTIVEVTFP